MRNLRGEEGGFGGERGDEVVLGRGWEIVISEVGLELGGERAEMGSVH